MDHTAMTDYDVPPSNAKSIIRIILAGPPCVEQNQHQLRGI